MSKYLAIVGFILFCSTSIFAGNFKSGIKNISERQKVFAIGDIHGDLDSTIRILKKIKLINNHNRWIGGKSILVQTGDQIDRGYQDRQVLEFFDKLQNEASQVGGDVYSVLGNHEIISARMRFEYAAYDDDSFLDFYTSLKDLPKRCRKDYERYTVPYFNTAYFRDNSVDEHVVPLNIRGRAFAFCPGGVMARLLSKRHITVILGKNLFVHGGMIAKYSSLGRAGLKVLNKEMSKWLKGKKFTPTLTGKFKKGFLRDKSAPFVSRFFSEDMNRKKCKILNRVLQDLKVERMIVGHTVQHNGITSDCGGKIWRIDTGFSSGFRRNNRKLEVLEIVGSRIKVKKIQ